MATISRCKICGKPVPPDNPIFEDHARKPYRLCSAECIGKEQEKESAEFEAKADWDTRCSKAIVRGLKESGETLWITGRMSE